MKKIAVIFGLLLMFSSIRSSVVKKRPKDEILTNKLIELEQSVDSLQRILKYAK